MNNLNKLKSELNELKEFVAKLESGELSIHELIQMEEVVRRLHEKTIILKYKAFEQKTGKVETVDSTPEEAVRDEPLTEAPEEDIPSIEFSIFAEEETIIETEVEEPIVQTPVTEADEEKEIIEEIAESEIVQEAPQTPQASHAGSKSFWEQISAQDDSLSSRFAGSKLDTLIGAFGLNEKLRYINDLFDGSSELFSDAIKLLDSQSDLDAAKVQVDKLANEHSWDPEEETVVEFMTYINRRYA